MRTYNSHALSWRGNDLRCAGKTIAGITPDQTYAGMWRVVRPDGRLSDMVNKTRAKDAATAIALSILNWGGKETASGARRRVRVPHRCAVEPSTIASAIVGRRSRGWNSGGAGTRHLSQNESEPRVAHEARLTKEEIVNTDYLASRAAARKPAHKLAACIFVRGTTIHLGFYDSKEAVSRVKAAALYAYARGWRPARKFNTRPTATDTSRVGTATPKSQKESK
jgi:hypothetical protein